MKRHWFYKKSAVLTAVILVFSAVLNTLAANTAVCRSVPNDAKKIAITFDDGPHTQYTEDILDILDKNGVKATFFMVGSQAIAHPELVSMVAKKGHEIGNHTYSHNFISRESDSKIKDELTRTSEIIRNITGTAPVVFRPPGGCYSDRSISTVISLGYTPVTWSKDSNDWRMKPVDTIVSEMTKNIKSGDIMLFHDFNKKGSPTPEAISKIIPILKKQGFEFVTVSELLKA